MSCNLPRESVPDSKPPRYSKAGGRQNLSVRCLIPTDLSKAARLNDSLAGGVLEAWDRFTGMHDSAEKARGRRRSERDTACHGPPRRLCDVAQSGTALSGALPTVCPIAQTPGRQSRYLCGAERWSLVVAPSACGGPPRLEMRRLRADRGLQSTSRGRSAGLWLNQESAT
jgi:hypothetical protein